MTKSLDQNCRYMYSIKVRNVGAQWLSGRVLDSRPRGRGFEPHRRHCVVSLNKNIKPSLVLVQPRKTRPFITERLLMGRKESKQNRQKKVRKGAKIRNRYNQVPHRPRIPNGKVTTTQFNTTDESQKVSPFQAGDHKAAMSRRESMTNTIQK